MLKTSEDYQRYQNAEKELHENPQLARIVDEYRREVYHLQTSGEDTYSRLDELSNKYTELKEDALADRYLDAENAVCRLLRKTMGAIVREVGVRLPANL